MFEFYLRRIDFIIKNCRPATWLIFSLWHLNKTFPDDLTMTVSLYHFHCHERHISLWNYPFPMNISGVCVCVCVCVCVKICLFWHYWLFKRTIRSIPRREFVSYHWMPEALFLEVWWPKCEADHSAPTRAEVRNDRSFTSRRGAWTQGQMYLYTIMTHALYP